MNEVINVENLGKKYIISHQGSANDTFREMLTENAKKIFKSRLFRSTKEEFWALRNVSIQVNQGERIGIIGRNGAGKSTLLKLLSRITEPTEGRIRIKGRVASLLEVGTGFHAELTGRENIYLNGAVLGMSRSEIKRKFDDIVEFSGVEEFLDTPVKRYSSGMYVRLAFAIAAHLESEILLVDEVLAVGDAQFQKKCLGTMESTSKNKGKTILFVSHNMGMISHMCEKSILLENGKIAMFDSTNDVIPYYYGPKDERNGEIIWNNVEKAPGDSNLRILAVRVISMDKPTSDVLIDEDIILEVEYYNFKNGAFLSTSFHLLTILGIEVLATANLKSATLEYDGWFGKPYPIGRYKSRCTIPRNLLNEGSYYINVVILNNITEVVVKLDNVIKFSVLDSGNMREEYKGKWIGIIRPKLFWETKFLGK